MAINDKVCAKRLAYYIKQRKLTLRALSEATSINATSISNLLNSRGTKILKYYQTLADFFGISSGFLIGEHDEINGPPMTGKRTCRICGREIPGYKITCSTCLRDQKLQKRTDHGLVGMMKEASLIAREGRKRGMSYGQYAPIYDSEKRSK